MEESKESTCLVVLFQDTVGKRAPETGSEPLTFLLTIGMRLTWAGEEKDPHRTEMGIGLTTIPRVLIDQIIRTSPFGGAE